MSITATTTIDVEHELAYRAGDGVEVTLLWQPGDDRVVVDVRDSGRADWFRLRVPNDRALDAFHHPYAYRA